MSASIADPSAPAPEQSPEGPPAGQAVPESTVPPGPSGSPGAGAPACANCGTALAPGQDWCLHCGAATPGSGGASGWRPAGAIAAITLALVLGAAAAGVAALGKKSKPAPVVTVTVAQTTTPAASTLAPTTPTTPSTTVLPLTKPPKIPLKAVTPSPTATTPATTAPTKTSTTKSSETAAKEESSSKTGGSGAGKEPEPILLDTNAAQTYNPYGYAAAGFGDPSLTIDGDTSTGWSAEVNPATAPRMAEGVVIDLKTPQKLSFLKLVTTTPGMAVQVYGANGQTVPGSITAKAWVTLSHQLTVHKRHARIGLRNRKQAYRYVVLWISRAPESAVGTAQAPGHVTVNEIELLPAAP